MRKFLSGGAFALTLFAAARGAIDPRTFDPAVKPQDDFYRFVNGPWLEQTQIPANQAGWGAFAELTERNAQNVRALCERAAAESSGASRAEQMVGDFYASGMDEAAIEAAGIAPLREELARIAAIKSPADLMAAIAHLKLVGVPAGFGFSAGADAKNSDQTIAHLRQGGLSLPGGGRDADRDYYLNPDEKSQKLREDYVAHVEKMLALAGDSAAAAHDGAAAVLRIETALAQVSLTRARLRDPQASYHKVTLAELPNRDGAIDWPAFFSACGAPPFTELNLAHPEFFAGFAALVTSAPLADWQAYLRWKLIHDSAPFLAAAIADENFRFYSTTVRGTGEQLPRWRRVAMAVDASIGDALGQLYVAEYFPPAAKARVLKLVEDLRAALAERIQALAWMDAPTKAKAQAKLAAFSVKMGYPDKWKDYAGVRIERGPYVLNVMRASAYEVHRNLAKIGQLVDKTEWGMTPPTVNASYSPLMNSITFPAGILQPPFFDPKADDAANYGAIGAVIGHEMSHGFDDSGRQYDAQGNLTDWWTPESAARFKERAAAIVAQFSAYEPLPGLPLKGELTQGENIADLGGLKIAFTALQKALAGKPRPVIDGYTPEQRFFLSYASIWRNKYREPEQRRRVNVDPHSPGRFRVLGPLSNLPEFSAAFEVPEGSPMRRPASERVEIW
jgi:predicted metalloendopeptidase